MEQVVDIVRLKKTAAQSDAASNANTFAPVNFIVENVFLLRTHCCHVWPTTGRVI